jgi:hypothetical protein
MSAELLEECQNEKGESVGLKMNAHSYGWITIYESDVIDAYGTIVKYGPISSFELSPNDEGFDNARKIISALEAWMDHVRLTK